MDVLTVAAVLSLLSVSAAKPLNCEDLVQPLALNITQISGKWIFIEGTTDHQKYATILKTVNSSFIDIVMSHNGTSVIKDRHMMNGQCLYLVHNMTFSDNAFHVLYANGTASTCTILPAGPDSLVLNSISVDVGDIIKSLYIFGRTKTLSQSALEMYHKQVECLKFPQPSFKYDGKQDSCPDKEKPAVTEEDKQGDKQ